MPKAVPRRKARSEMPAREVRSDGGGCTVGKEEEEEEDGEGGGRGRGNVGRGLLFLMSTSMSASPSVSG